MRQLMRRTVGFAPESSQEWFGLCFGLFVGFLVGWAIVEAIVAAAGGN